MTAESGLSVANSLATSPGDASSDPVPAPTANGHAHATAATTSATAASPAAAPKPTVDAQGRALNPRSCVTCRKRKVKCDKIHPCTNCSRAHIECIFPAPGRAPRRVKKIGEGRDKELLERLRRLEGVVKNLGVDVPGSQPETEQSREEEDTPPQVAAPAQDEILVEGPISGAVSENTSQANSEGDALKKARWVEEQQQGRFENRFGRLVVNEGKSRYVNNSFWANLSNEVEDLKGILNQSSDEDEEILDTSPGASHPQTSRNHHGFIFGLSSNSVDLLSLHPYPGHVDVYWNIYKERVDPLVKVLHLPSLEPTILRAASQLTGLSRGFECLLFAIYYCAATSLNARDCLVQLGEEKAVLLSRYRFAVEQALARANFLVTEEIVVLQAFVLFLTCLRRNNDARVIWTLTGLVVRIAQTIGIHRDGSHFGLPPFEVEMRRRLWWFVCILDTRASEDHGCDPTILEQSFDTKMPLNINDSDISPDAKDFPPERQGCTEMSFCLLRFDVANYFRRINYIPPGRLKETFGEQIPTVTLEDKERWITECHNKIEEKYLNHCDMSVPLFWVTATVARLMMSKMWLMVYHPFLRQNGGSTISQETKDKLFITSLENMEYSLLLETEARTMKWGWLFRTYVQWHALAFMLSELCHRTTGPMVERAWAAVEKTRDGRWAHDFQDDTNTGHLWRPLKKLYRKAKDARHRGLLEERMAEQRNATPPMRTYSPNANPMFGNPRRPQMTRAPLSQAQLRRFVEGPLFGQAPLDKHEMLRSPRLSETSGEDPMESVSLGPDPRQSRPSQGTNYLLQNFSTAADGTADGSFGAATGPAGLQPNPLQHQAFSQMCAPGAQSLDLNMSEPGIQNGSLFATNVANPGTALRTDSLDSFDNDFSIMDTSGDVDWANWDQLVRQFGMDIDSGVGDGAGALDPNAVAWNNPVWDAGLGGANMRMGMGGGDVF